ncbi:MAG TPA: GNAT family N-acetyltransferase [Xanthobacteraceae bacterium]|nr:GNAT family N-acetyltransferase [Xanthobacteraceae bacterium]
MSQSPTFQVRVERSIQSIAKDTWDSCAKGFRELPESKSELSQSGSQALESALEDAFADSDNPFISHDFLASLETSRSVGGRSGWLPQHLVVEDDSGEIHAVAPCYLKSHSQGEYVFDHGWADAFERAGGNYYPKLQVAVPFTPVTGPRLLVKAGPHAEAARNALVAGMVELCKMREASSVHVTFAQKSEWNFLTEAGMLARTDRQFHWHNQGYANFDGFLAALSSNKRKTIRRERRDALESGIEIVRLTGGDLTEAVWDAFFAFYMDTGSRKWGRPYLTRDFFSHVSATMADKILLIMAKRDGQYIAGALNFIGRETLYGRNWGAIEHHPFLHFEVCYYQAIEYAIERGLKSVEAGAQGEHKLLRGYVPVPTYSSHYILHPGLRRAVGDYLLQEREYVEAEREHLAEAAPYRRTAT